MFEKKNLLECSSIEDVTGTDCVVDCCCRVSSTQPPSTPLTVSAVIPMTDMEHSQMAVT